MPLKNRIIFLKFFLSIFIGAPIFSQTGPAGVGSNISNVVWLDANTLNLTNGALVSAIADVSGNGNNFSQILSSKQPVFETGAVNGLPALKFDGIDDFLKSGAIVALQTNNITYFVVLKRALLKTQTVISCKYSDYTTEKWSTLSGYADNRLFSRHFSPNSATQQHTSHVDNGNFTFISSHITPTTNTQYNKGVLAQSKTANFTLPGTHQYVTLGNLGYNHSQNHALNGYIAEVVIYNSSLNNLERVLVENYLGAKYNLPIPSDFYAYQASHNIGLIGIGSNGVNSQQTARGNGIVQISSPDDLNSNEYLLVGHTNVSLTDFTTTGLPPSISSYQYFTRTWRVDETGEVGNIEITFDLSGGLNFADPTSYVLLVDSDDDFSDATIVNGVYNSVDESMTFNVNLSNGEFFTLAGLFQSLVINSVNDGDWNNPNTWDCLCLPGSFDQVFVNPGHEVEVNVHANCLDINIESGGTLSMNSATTLSIFGNFNNYGTFDSGNGTIAFRGGNSQMFDDLGNGTTFNNITINKTIGNVLFFASDILINGTIDLQQGNLDISDSGMNFIINSTSSQNGGRIGSVTSAGTIVGTFGVRRFIDSGNADWRDLSAPVSGATFANWDSEIYMSGPSFPDGCAAGFGDPCFKSVRYTTNGIQYQIDDVNTTLVSGKGYHLWLGDDLNTFSGATLTSYGTINGPANIVLSLNTGWHTIGNPYASQMLYSLTTRTSQISNYFYVYDNTIGDYQWYDGVSGLGSISALDNGLMAVGQGVWVYATSLGSLTFHQSDKTSQTATYIRSQELATADKNLTLVLKQEGTTYQTSIMLEASSFATDGADTLADMMYLETGLEAAPRLYMNYPEHKVRKNFIQNDSRNKSFELYTKIKNEGYYSFSIENMNDNFSDYRAILLFDNETGEFVNLKNETSYTFYSDVYEGSRFTLVLTNLEIVPEATVESLSINEDELAGSELITITQMGHLFDIVSTEDLNQNSEISLVNVLGQTTVFTEWAQIVQGSNIVAVPEDIKGVHVLVIRTGDEVITKKVVL